MAAKKGSSGGGYNAGTIFRAVAVGAIAMGSKGAALAKSAGGLKGLTLVAGAGAAAAASTMQSKEVK